MTPLIIGHLLVLDLSHRKLLSGFALPLREVQIRHAAPCTVHRAPSKHYTRQKVLSDEAWGECTDSTVASTLGILYSTVREENEKIIAYHSRII